MTGDVQREDVQAHIQQAIDARIVREELFAVMACDLDTESMAADIVADLGLERAGWMWNGEVHRDSTHEECDPEPGCVPVYTFRFDVEEPSDSGRHLTPSSDGSGDG